METATAAPKQCLLFILNSWCTNEKMRKLSSLQPLLHVSAGCMCAAVASSAGLPQNSTPAPGCLNAQVWWWRPRPAWGPVPRRRCWGTARTHGSGTLWSSASNGSWESRSWLQIERREEGLYSRRCRGSLHVNIEMLMWRFTLSFPNPTFMKLNLFYCKIFLHFHTWRGPKTLSRNAFFRQWNTC